MFDERKAEILNGLEDPNVRDSSPKGFVDEAIWPLVRLINSHTSMVTTSSCSGRVSVFVEAESSSLGSTKGAGGSWAFVTHDPDGLDTKLGSQGWWEQLLQSKYPLIDDTGASSRLILYKFEPMILHVQCRDWVTATKLYGQAVQSGFRESGIGSKFLVAIRGSVRLDVPIASVSKREGQVEPLVTPSYVAMLLDRSRLCFNLNARRIWILEQAIQSLVCDSAVESKQDRAQRKRAEGLARKSNRSD